MMDKFCGQQLVADFYGCNRKTLDNLEELRRFIHTICDDIRTEIVEEAYHKFDPIGISAFAVITTSHFSIHTWPEFGYAAIDIFSCDGRLTTDICKRMQELLEAKDVVTSLIQRQVGERPGRLHLAG